jgi:hypothetical protein
MKLCIIRNPTVASWINDLHCVFAGWLVEHYSLQHNLDVYLHPVRVLDTRKGLAWGFFTPGRRPVIVLACRPGSGSFTQCYNHLLDTFAHEWCEYEKWRDGKVRNHRGLQRRVDALIHRFRSYLKGSNNETACLD